MLVLSLVVVSVDALSGTVLADEWLRLLVVRCGDDRVVPELTTLLLPAVAALARALNMLYCS